ncbi:MAG: hypothetical protein L6R40_001492 [Gallowayella cf. fulva]|nr:MAG: hypothetical protein L6R40_001492 [Xanthomendoza cf. fulva]
MYRRQLLRCSRIESTLPTWILADPSVFSRIGAILGFRSASSSSTRWQTRQGRDKLATKARVEGLKSRAAYKLLEVAVDRTSPNGRIVGIDVIPAQPPAGVSTIQGNFLSSAVQDEVKKFLRATQDGRHNHPLSSLEHVDGFCAHDSPISSARSYLEQEKQSGVLAPEPPHTPRDGTHARISMDDPREGRMVDVVLSDMSAPWEQTEGFWKRSLSDPYYRMMNTSGINFRDHAGSMDLCQAALRFAFDTLRSGGHFVYKPASSRSESKEAFFVALRRKADIQDADVFK